MITTSTLKLTSAAIATALFLAACGGGGGGDSSTQQPTKQPTQPVQTGIAPQTSVPAPTYDASSFQYAAFQSINDYRNAMGAGMLKQDPVLDTSSTAHSLYTLSNLKSGAITALEHNENASFANYYGDTPLSRAQKAGAPASEWISEVIAVGSLQATPAASAADCVSQLLSTVYHLVGLTNNQESIGVGYNAGDASYSAYACTFDFGTSTGVVGNPGPNTLSYHGGQQIPVGTVVHSPYTNESGVATAMHTESPNPAPDLAAPGRPILVRANSENGDTLTVSQFSLTDASGTSVAARIMVPASAQSGSTATTTTDPNATLPNGTAVLLPLAKLSPNTTYNVSFTGVRDGATITSAWSFTTGAN